MGNLYKIHMYAHWFLGFVYPQKGVSMPFICICIPVSVSICTDEVFWPLSALLISSHVTTPSNMASRLQVKTKAQKKKTYLPLQQCKYTEIQSYFF